MPSKAWRLSNSRADSQTWNFPPALPAARPCDKGLWSQLLESWSGMILRSRSTWDTQWVQDNPEHQNATYSQNKKQEEGWWCGSVAKYLPSMHEILESVPSTTKTKHSTGHHSDSHYVTRRGPIWAERTQNVVNVGYVCSQYCTQHKLRSWDCPSHSPNLILLGI